MTAIRRTAIAAILLMIAAAPLAMGQVRTQTRLNFTINVPYAMEMGGYTLSPGKYILLQSSQQPNLFSLYAEDLAREPIAMIQTTRTRYWTIPQDRTTKIVLEIDESSLDSRPVLQGWNVPYADGWEVTSVVAKNNNYMVRIK